jgi:hypothetical protein
MIANHGSFSLDYYNRVQKVWVADLDPVVCCDFW